MRNKKSGKIKKAKIERIRPDSGMGIEIILLVIIFIYVFYYIISALTKTTYSVYTVKMGSIAENNLYDAMAIREETVVNADKDGYPFYYLQNSVRAGANSNVYGIDTEGSLSKKLQNIKSDTSSMSKSDESYIENSISSFLDTYDNGQAEKTGTFRADLDEEIKKVNSESAIASMENDISSAVSAGTYQIYKAGSTGFLIYSLDGYEGTDLSNFPEKMNSAAGTLSQDLRVNSKISAGTPVYKLITSDNWNLVMAISDKTLEKVKDRKSLKIRFEKDGSETSCSSSVTNVNGKNYLILSLHDSMERFAAYRFISIELLLDSRSGLKIPSSAIAGKDCYVVPKDYFIAGNNSDTLGLMLKTSDGDKFITPDIHKSTKNSYYILKEDVDGNTIQIPGSSSTYSLSSNVKKVKGVYNVNKGFADYRIITTLYSTDEYSIIEADSSYGVSLYDHIALDADKITNGKIIY